MLQLKNIYKNYLTGDQTVEALKDVSLSFRKSEFVAILGPSGCGKTTLLNIVGGLDRYTSGDIVINGISTKQYEDGDWDAYRNHSVGFVFQSYNLIPHQTIVENVELALTLSGVSAKERRERAVEALNQVGLSEKLNKLPAQLSGGQMQRVAIARAIVNDPDIILADEPTGALDTETSVQVLDILRELSKDRLVVMVTHNPELANEYATRIIRLKDGKICEDSDPFAHIESEKVAERKQTESEKVAECKQTESEKVAERKQTESEKVAERKQTESEKVAERKQTETSKAKVKKPSMSLKTALSLSLKNLITKKARTILTSFAGSIGIIGIALILSLSTGFNAYVTDVQRDTLSNYPVKIAENDISMEGFITSFMGSTKQEQGKKYPEGDKVISGKMFNGMLDSLSSSVNTNNLGDFKKYLDEHPELTVNDKISAVNYTYNFPLYLFQNAHDENSKSYEPAYKDKYKKVNSIGPMENYFDVQNLDKTILQFFETYYTQFKKYMESSMTWGELAGSINLVRLQYDVLAGTLPDGGKMTDSKGDYFPITVVVDQYNTIPDYSLYMMGIMSDMEVKYMFSEMVYTMIYRATDANYRETVERKLKEDFAETLPNGIKREYTFDDIIDREFFVLLDNDLYQPNGTMTYNGKEYNRYKPADIEDYTAFYTDKFENKANKPVRLKVQSVIRLKRTVNDGALSRNIYYTPELTDYLIDKTLSSPVVADQLKYIENPLDPSEENPYCFNVISEGDNISKCAMRVSDFPETVYKQLGIVDKDEPSAISFYPTSFENKDYVIELINGYNKDRPESKKIQYTDYIGMMVSSITTIINAVSYVLIAFVSISLVVSSIMIGVITYISVLERTKEIGILRSLGASKRDVARVFNAETMIIGFISGAMGIGITLLLNIPINLIIESLSGIANVASLPLLGGIMLVIISVTLTLIAGIIPSRIASTRDPVIALRGE